MKVTLPRQFTHVTILALLILALGLPVAAAGAQPATLESPALAPAALYQGTLTATPDALVKSGAPGTSLVFYVSIAATQNDNIAVTTSNTLSWTVNANPNPVDLTTRTADSMELSVSIPPTAKHGDETVITVYLTGAANPAMTTSFSVTARAVLPQPTQQPQANRPLVVIGSYYLDKDTIVPGDSFNLYLSVKNEGGQDALNLVFSFTGENFLPQETGGVVALGSLAADGSRDISQRFLVSTTLWGQTNAILPVKLTYNNPAGEVFTETFNLTLAVRGTTAGQAPTKTPTPTPTPTTAPRPQLVVSGYQVDVDPLQPGTVFNLELEISNLGNAEARGVTMVLGGGGSNTEPNPSGTPVPGGVSGGSSDLANFAPFGSSNLVYIGDAAPGASLKTNTRLIVNVSSNPGAYPLKLSFVYNDARGIRLVDDQVITLLIYRLPLVEVNFYRDPGPIFAMQPNTLPIQVVNLGRSSAVMGNMTVSAENADLMNNVSLVGTLEMGGYFPLDVMIIPHAPGPLDVNVTINYTDDFNQPRSITQTLHLEVQEGAPPVEGPTLGPDGMPIDPGKVPGEGEPVSGVSTEETFWDKVLRFLKGLVGLDSAPPQPDQPMIPVPNEGVPPGGKSIPPKGKG